MQGPLLLLVAAAILFGPQPASDAYRNGGTAQSSMPRRATGEIESFVKHALEDRLAANNVPDHNLLGKSTRIAVREEMPGVRMTLGDGALPQRKGYEFYVLSLAKAQANADEIGKAVYFLTVDRPLIGEDTATVWLGVDVVFPREPKVIKLCCCAGHAQFRRVQGRWTFVKWASTICS